MSAYGEMRRAEQQREARQRARERDDWVLEAAAGLDPADPSPWAQQVREVAASVADHREMERRRAQWAAEDAADAAAGSGVRVPDSAESAAAQVAPAPVLSIGPRSAEQVGYELAWESRQGRAEDWRRDSSLPGREVSMLTVGEDRPAAARPRVTAAGQAAASVTAGAGVEAADWSAGSCQEASLRRLADPAASAADDDVRWASYVDSRGVDDGMVDE